MRKKWFNCILILLILLAGTIHVYAQGEAQIPAETDNWGNQNYTVWASTVNSYLVGNADETFTRVEYDYSQIYVEDYDPEFQLISQKSIPMELTTFGGFYAGKDFNFLIFGQNNAEQNNSAEVIRVVRYTKDWKRVDQASLCGANTTQPFRAGSLRATEYNGILYIRTCHEMYKSADGLNHQANLTMSIDIASMTITDSFYDVLNIGYGYSSHSFNQFIQVDGTNLLAVDHGDAYPRSVVLVKYAKPAGQKNFTGRVSYVNVLPIMGNIGANATGVSVGGFEASDTSYLVAGNTVSQGENYNPNGQRNIFLTVTNKKNFSEEGTRIQYLTTYTDADDISVSTPHLVKINGNQFLVLWTEDGELRYVFTDASGNVTSEIYSGVGALSDCKPVVVQNTVYWYVTNNSKPVFYAISLNQPDTVKVYAPKITIIWDPRGGKLEENTWTVSYGQVLGELPVPENKSAYQFLGWYTHPYDSGQQVTGDMVVAAFSEITLYAHWKELEHTCEWEAVSVIPATCTSLQETYYECKFCSSGYTIRDGYYQHTWDEGRVIIPATCTEDGIIEVSCTLCSVTEIQTIEAICPGSAFYDTPAASSWAHAGIDFAIERKLFNGMSANRFEPDTAMSRAMLVTVLWRYAGTPMAGGNQFIDVENGRWYTDAIAWASETGVVNGIGKGRFAPDEKITREQMAVILYRYSNQQNLDTTKRADLSHFPDADSVSRFAREAVSWAVAEGLIKGDGSFLKPQGDATRAQVATILMRYIQNVAEE